MLGWWTERGGTAQVDDALDAGEFCRGDERSGGAEFHFAKVRCSSTHAVHQIVCDSSSDERACDRMRFIQVATAPLDAVRTRDLCGPTAGGYHGSTARDQLTHERAADEPARARDQHGARAAARCDGHSEPHRALERALRIEGDRD